MLVLLGLLLPIAVLSQGVGGDCPWDYDNSEDWPNRCNGQWRICGDGVHQSPVNIRSSDVVQADRNVLKDLQYDYQRVIHTEISEDGAAVKVVVTGRNYIWGGPLPQALGSFHLIQFHFHTPGEHSQDGLRAAMEVHLVHLASDNATRAVVSVRFKEGRHSEWLERVIATRELIQNNVNNTVILEADILNPSSVMPDDLSYYYYTGSLTTPPCSEGVYWILLDTYSEVSEKQIRTINQWEGLNNRPLSLTSKAIIYKYDELIPSVYVPPDPKENYAYAAAFGVFLTLTVICALLNALFIYRFRQADKIKERLERGGTVEFGGVVATPRHGHNRGRQHSRHERFEDEEEPGDVETGLDTVGSASSVGSSSRLKRGRKSATKDTSVVRSASFGVSFETSGGTSSSSAPASSSSTAVAPNTSVSSIRPHKGHNVSVMPMSPLNEIAAPHSVPSQHGHGTTSSTPAPTPTPHKPAISYKDKLSNDSKYILPGSQPRAVVHSVHSAMVPPQAVSSSPGSVPASTSATVSAMSPIRPMPAITEDGAASATSAPVAAAPLDLTEFFTAPVVTVSTGSVSAGSGVRRASLDSVGSRASESSWTHIERPSSVASHSSGHSVHSTPQVDAPANGQGHSPEAVSPAGDVSPNGAGGHATGQQASMVLVSRQSSPSPPLIVSAPSSPPAPPPGGVVGSAPAEQVEAHEQSFQQGGEQQRRLTPFTHQASPSPLTNAGVMVPVVPPRSAFSSTDISTSTSPSQSQTTTLPSLASLATSTPSATEASSTSTVSNPALPTVISDSPPPALSPTSGTSLTANRTSPTSFFAVNTSSSPVHSPYAKNKHYFKRVPASSSPPYTGSPTTLGGRPRRSTTGGMSSPPTSPPSGSHRAHHAFPPSGSGSPPPPPPSTSPPPSPPGSPPPGLPPASPPYSPRQPPQQSSLQTQPLTAPVMSSSGPGSPALQRSSSAPGRTSPGPQSGLSPTSSPRSGAPLSPRARTKSVLHVYATPEPAVAPWLLSLASSSSANSSSPSPSPPHSPPSPPSPSHQTISPRSTTSSFLPLPTPSASALTPTSPPYVRPSISVNVLIASQLAQTRAAALQQQLLHQQQQEQLAIQSQQFLLAQQQSERRQQELLQQQDDVPPPPPPEDELPHLDEEPPIVRGNSSPHTAQAFWDALETSTARAQAESPTTTNSAVPPDPYSPSYSASLPPVFGPNGERLSPPSAMLARVQSRSHPRFFFPHSNTHAPELDGKLFKRVMDAETARPRQKLDRTELSEAEKHAMEDRVKYRKRLKWEAMEWAKREREEQEMLNDIDEQMRFQADSRRRAQASRLAKRREKDQSHVRNDGAVSPGGSVANTPPRSLPLHPQQRVPQDLAAFRAAAAMRQQKGDQPRRPTEDDDDDGVIQPQHVLQVHMAPKPKSKPHKKPKAHASIVSDSVEAVQLDAAIMTAAVAERQRRSQQNGNEVSEKPRVKKKIKHKSAALAKAAAAAAAMTLSASETIEAYAPPAASTDAPNGVPLVVRSNSTDSEQSYHSEDEEALNEDILNNWGSAPSSPTEALAQMRSSTTGVTSKVDAKSQVDDPFLQLAVKHSPSPPISPRRVQKTANPDSSFDPYTPFTTFNSPPANASEPTDNHFPIVAPPSLSESPLSTSPGRVESPPKSLNEPSLIRHVTDPAMSHMTPATTSTTDLEGPPPLIHHVTDLVRTESGMPPVPAGRMSRTPSLQSSGDTSFPGLIRHVTDPASYHVQPEDPAPLEHHKTDVIMPSEAVHVDSSSSTSLALPSLIRHVTDPHAPTSLGDSTLSGGLMPPDSAPFKWSPERKPSVAVVAPQDDDFALPPLGRQITDPAAIELELPPESLPSTYPNLEKLASLVLPSSNAASLLEEASVQDDFGLPPFARQITDPEGLPSDARTTTLYADLADDARRALDIVHFPPRTPTTGTDESKLSLPDVAPGS